VFIALSLNRDVRAGRSNTRLPFWLQKLLWFILGYLVPALVFFVEICCHPKTRY